MSPAVAWAPAPSAPTLPPGEVHVWRVDLDAAPPRLAALAATLSTAERGRALRFRFDAHRDRWVAARGKPGPAPLAIAACLGRVTHRPSCAI